MQTRRRLSVLPGVASARASFAGGAHLGLQQPVQKLRAATGSVLAAGSGQQRCAATTSLHHESFAKQVSGSKLFLSDKVLNGGAMARERDAGLLACSFQVRDPWGDG